VLFYGGNIMKTKYVAAAVLSALICNPFNAAAEGKNGIAASVNGTELTVAELKDAYNANPRLKEQVKFEQFYPQAVMSWVSGQILNQVASKSDVKSTKEYKEATQNFEYMLVNRLYVQQQITNKITDEEVKKTYDQLKKDFKSEKQVSARHVLVEDETTAKDLISKLKKGTKFDDLAKYSKDKNLNLGYFTKNMMVPEFGDVVFKMKKGEYNETPIKTKFGYHVVIVDDVRNTEMPTYEQVAPQIKNALTEQGIAKLIEKQSKKEKVNVYSLDGETIDLKAPEAENK